MNNWSVNGNFLKTKDELLKKIKSCETKEQVNEILLEYIPRFEKHDAYIFQYLVVSRTLIMAEELIVPFYKYQLEYVLGGGRF